MELRSALPWAVALLLPAVSVADITNVRVLGQTSTQAVIAYTAPDTAPCQIAVSTSTSFSPLAPDVDPAKFAGANNDSRPGNVSLGRARIFVVGKRSVETDLQGGYTSRALQAATAYHYQITCLSMPREIRVPNWSTQAAGDFTTRTIPFGTAYADPIPIDPTNNGAYLSPTFSTTDRSSSTVDPRTGALVKNLTLPGDMQGMSAAGMGSSGTGVICHPTPVKASDENKFGYHCQLSFGSGTPGLYWIATDGEVRFLGRMMSNYTETYNYTDCAGSLSAPFDSVDPNTFYCSLTPSADPTYTHRILVKATYTGHNSPGQDADLTNQGLGALPHTTYTIIVPPARYLGLLLSEFDPNYSGYAAACCGNYRSGDWANGKFFFYTWGPSQDTFGWMAEFDPSQTADQQMAAFGKTAGCIDNPPVTGSTYRGQPGCIVARTGTFTGQGGSGFRWSVLHTLDLTPASALVSVTLNALAMKSNLDYRVTLATPLSSIPGVCSMPKPAGSYIADWPDSSWSAGCSNIQVAGEPALSGTSPGYPLLIAAAPMDLLSVQTNQYNHHEILRLLDKGADGKTWYVQRQYYYRSKNGQYCTSGISGCSNVYPYSSVNAGGTLGMLSPAVYPDPNVTGMQVWWDPVAGALNTNYANTYRDPLPQSHPAYVNHPIFGRWTYINGSAMTGSEPARLLSPTCWGCVDPPSGLTTNLPTFNGIPFASSVTTPLFIETHPSLSVTNPKSEDAYKQAVDNHPYYGNTALASQANVSLVNGQLYRIRGTNVAANYKLVPYFANSGNRAMKEVSGPSVALATDASSQFQWCVALNPGECYQGSVAGDIFFNAPNVVNPYCTNDWTTLQGTTTVPNDVCVSVSNADVQAIEMRNLAADPLGLQVRVISNSFGQYDGQSVFWNSRTLPDASWLFTSIADGSIKLFNIPPAVPDNENRNAYVPAMIDVPGAPGVDNVLVEFGYAEDGSVNNLYCTARQETCVAQSRAIDTAQPFYFEQTEAPSITGTPCSAGCSVAVPAIPDRVLYYRVTYRDSSNNVISKQPVSATPIP